MSARETLQLYLCVQPLHKAWTLCSEPGARPCHWPRPVPAGKLYIGDSALASALAAPVGIVQAATAHLGVFFLLSLGVKWGK